MSKKCHILNCFCRWNESAIHWIKHGPKGTKSWRGEPKVSTSLVNVCATITTSSLFTHWLCSHLLNYPNCLCTHQPGSSSEFMKPSCSRNKRWGTVAFHAASFQSFCRGIFSDNYLPSNYRKCATVVKHTGLDESDESAESENDGATSDNPSDGNTGSGSKGRSYLSMPHLPGWF